MDETYPQKLEGGATSTVW